MYCGTVQYITVQYSTVQHSLGQLSDLHHDDVVAGHVPGQLLDGAPVGGLLARDGDVGGQHLQGPGVGGQAGLRAVRTQHQHPLHPRLDEGQVEPVQGLDGTVQEAVDDVDRTILTKRGGGGREDG